MLNKFIGLEVVDFIKENHLEDDNVFISQLKNKYGEKLPNIKSSTIYNWLKKETKEISKYDISYSKGHSMFERYLSYYKDKYFYSLDEVFISKVSLEGSIITITTNKNHQIYFEIYSNGIKYKNNKEESFIPYTYIFNKVNEEVNIEDISIGSFSPNIRFVPYYSLNDYYVKKTWFNGLEVLDKCYIDFANISDKDIINFQIKITPTNVVMEFEDCSLDIIHCSLSFSPLEILE